jgi:hypothetical protein
MKHVSLSELVNIEDRGDKLKFTLKNQPNRVVKKNAITRTIAKLFQ